MNETSAGAVAALGRAPEPIRIHDRVKPAADGGGKGSPGAPPAARVTISRQASQTSFIKEYVRRLFEEQGIALQGDIWDDMTVEEAQAAIAEGGEWSAEAVAGRILDFVANISGGDPEMSERLREAVRQGFEEARQAFGGWLPEVSERTFALVMERFDEAFQRPE